MINFAVMTFMYRKWAESENGSHERLINILKEAGADGIEAFANHFMGDDALVSLYQKEMKNADIKMPVMDLISNLACKEKAARDEAYEFMRKGIDICEALGTEIVHLAGCKLVEGVSPEEGRKLIAEGMSDFADDIEKRGMTLAFEDFNPSPGLICSAADCLSILEQTDGRVRFVFDTGNFEAEGEKAEDNFDKLINHTCHFHFKDFCDDGEERGQTGTHFGEGKINNREIAAKINNFGYNGWVALESYPQDGNGPEETVAKELATLKSMF
ncbi:MAG: sugar phosphate isomerase/epimerase family protein [Planctomycetota bacterium]|jgi:sugar phosphate isomerase/epimerase